MRISNLVVCYISLFAFISGMTVNETKHSRFMLSSEITTSDI
jgi:hypothetical protein